MAEQLKVTYGSALVSGSIAGFTVDVSLFPLDTLKTRLQSPEGFAKAGGFRGIYSGLASAAIGSMPTAAVFFCTYEFVKNHFNENLVEGKHFIGHAFAASCGETAACFARVPTEVVKQRAQSSRNSSLKVFVNTLKQDGPLGFYRGFITTVMREIPFSFVQFPLWEGMKHAISVGQNAPIESYQSAYCGAISGAFAAGLTNPLDVAKTRIMLAESGSRVARGSILYALTQVVDERGPKGLLAGIGPRILWMSFGGYIFLGTYEFVRKSIQRHFDKG